MSGALLLEQKSLSSKTTSDEGLGPAVKMGIVDLCAGIGCVAGGFEATGAFETIALVDIDSDAQRAWQSNHSHAEYLSVDIQELKAGQVLQCADGRGIDGIVGCPPCQGFSAAGQRRSDDERNKLLASFFDVVSALSPRFFVMENVPAVLHREELREQEDALSNRYEIRADLMNAALFGLPQMRERAVVVGIDRELGVTPSLPSPTHLGSRPVFSYGKAELVTPRPETLPQAIGASPQLGVSTENRYDVADSLPDDPAELRDLVTVWDAIGDLPPLSIERSLPASEPSEFALALGGRSEGPHNHERWNHSKKTTERLASVAEGGRLNTERQYFSQAYARLHRRGLSRTITTNFHNAGSGRFTHPVEPRTLTVREAARLQGISDDFHFPGHASLQERQVGNAFPPPLAKAIGAHLAGQLREAGPW